MAVGDDILRLLKRYGLEELAGWASLMAISGASEDAIELSLYEQPAFKRRFPAIFELEGRGRPAISPEEYLEYERRMHATARSWGMSLTQDEINKMIGGEVSVAEGEGRIGLAGAAVFESPPEVRRELKRLYNISDSQLTRYWMDPKTEFAKLQQQYTASRISTFATTSGWGELERAEAEKLASAGMEDNAAQQGFSNLAAMRQIFEPIDRTEQAWGREQQINLLAFGQGQEELERRARRRTATFEEGGDFATSQAGVVGLGSATT